MRRAALMRWAMPLVGAAVMIAGSVATHPATVAASSATLYPEGIQDVLPAGARVEQAANAALQGGEGEAWAVLYSTAGEANPFARAHFAAIFVPDGEMWTRAYQREEGFSNAGALEVHEVGGVAAVAFFSYVGAHSQGVTVVRWDGAAFVEVLRTGSNTAGIALRDQDEDETPEVIVPWSPYCGSFAASPLLVHIYAWDGTAYGDATGQYAGLLVGYDEALRDAIGSGREQNADGLACLHTARAWLAGQIGDREAVQLACADARDASVDYRAAWAGELCRESTVGT